MIVIFIELFEFIYKNYFIQPNLMRLNHVPFGTFEFWGSLFHSSSWSCISCREFWKIKSFQLRHLLFLCGFYLCFQVNWGLFYKLSLVWSLVLSSCTILYSRLVIFVITHYSFSFGRFQAKSCLSQFCVVLMLLFSINLSFYLLPQINCSILSLLSGIKAHFA